MRGALRLGALLLAACACRAWRVAEVPRPQGPQQRDFVSDGAGIAGANAVAAANARLGALHAEEGFEVAVVFVPRMTPESPAEEGVEGYARALFDTWGVGSAERQNGVLLLFAMQERSMRLQTARGSRELLSDGVASQIIEQLKGKLRDGDNAGALDSAVDLIDRVLRGDNPFWVSDWLGAGFLGALALVWIGSIAHSVYHSLKKRGMRTEYKKRLSRMAELTGSSFVRGDLCGICLEDLSEADQQQPVVRIACKHAFHKACLERWLRVKNECPLCRDKDPLGAPRPPAVRPAGGAAGAAAQPPAGGHPHDGAAEGAPPAAASSDGAAAPDAGDSARGGDGEDKGEGCSAAPGPAAQPHQPNALDFDLILHNWALMYSPVAAEFQVTPAAGGAVSWAHVPPPPDSSGSGSSSSWGGGFSGGGGGASGSW